MEFLIAIVIYLFLGFIITAVLARFNLVENEETGTAIVCLWPFALILGFSIAAHMIVTELIIPKMLK